MADTIPESQIFSVCYPTVELGAGTFHSQKDKKPKKST